MPVMRRGLTRCARCPATTVDQISHEAFKRRTASARAVVRTGECSPYANVMFVEGIHSERQLVETASLHLAHRWSLGYALDEDLPDHSSLSQVR